MVKLANLYLFYTMEMTEFNPGSLPVDNDVIPGFKISLETRNEIIVCLDYIR